MSRISTHVLDSAAGTPASGIDVALKRQSGQGWETVGGGSTDETGRIGSLVDGEFESGIYRLIFATGPYQASHGLEPFFPEVSVTFEVRDAASDHHVPLLLSPFGYTTYRGS